VTEAPAIEGLALESLAASRTLSRVYKGRHLDTGDVVAVKVLTADTAKSRRYFEQEILILRRLQAIATTPRLLGSGCAGRQLYHVCGWARGYPLSMMLDRHLCDDLDQIVSIIRSLSLCLERMHENGICHRDVSPEHIYVDDQGSLTLIDYGMASPFRSLDPLQIERFAGYDTLAIGMVFSELLLGRRIFSYRKPALTYEIAAVSESLQDTALLPPQLRRALHYALGAPSEFCHSTSALGRVRPGHVAGMLDQTRIEDTAV